MILHPSAYKRFDHFALLMFIEPLALNEQSFLFFLTSFATTDQNVDMMIDGTTATCTEETLYEDPSKSNEMNALPDTTIRHSFSMYGWMLLYLVINSHVKGVGMIRAIFGTVQDSAVFVIFCLNMLYLSKNWCFKSIFLVFYILGLKVQKTMKNHRFLEKFNIFYIVISKYKLLSPYVHIKQLHSYQNIILTFAEYNCLFLGKNINFWHFFTDF